MSLSPVLILFEIIVLVFSLSLHEAAHAWAAMRLGDATAFMLGRVTLNPAKHIDPWGTIVMPLISLISGFPLIGWARPCPITLRNFRKVKRDDILTTLAGPLSNLLLAVVSLIGLVLLKHLPGIGEETVAAAVLMSRHVQVDMSSLPRIFPLALLLYYGILTNVLLFCFNLIPLPPLDGSRIIRYFLPYAAGQMLDRIGNWGIFIIFLFAGWILFPIYLPVLGLFNHALAAL